MTLEVAVLGLGEAGGTIATGRLDELEAAAAYLEELGVEPRVSRATAAWLETVIERE